MNTLTTTIPMDDTQTVTVPRLGHVHLQVADLDRAVRFYCNLLGFHVTAYGPDFGIPAAFLALDDYHHHLGLNTFHSLNGTPPPEGHTGLYHIALVYPSRAAFIEAVRRVAEQNWPIDSGVDHGATLSVYLRDPDGNGLELYYDLPQVQWVDEHGRLVLKAEPFDWHELLDEMTTATVEWGR
jgi:catechol 2,3-dioxygenase